MEVQDSYPLSIWAAQLDAATNRRYCATIFDAFEDELRAHGYAVRQGETPVAPVVEAPLATPRRRVAGPRREGLLPVEISMIPAYDPGLFAVRESGRAARVSFEDTLTSDYGLKPAGSGLATEQPERDAVLPCGVTAFTFECLQVAIGRARQQFLWRRPFPRTGGVGPDWLYYDYYYGYYLGWLEDILDFLVMKRMFIVSKEWDGTEPNRRSFLLTARMGYESDRLDEQTFWALFYQ
jgi:hypothetical protein